MSTKHLYCVPAALASSPRDAEVTELLSRVEKALAIPFERRTISQPREMDELRMMLIPLSVRERLRIRQAAKSKILYPHLVIMDGNMPVAFFPQIRRERNQRIEVGVSAYLKSLLAGSLESLIPIPSIERKIPRREKVDEDRLKQGYLAMADEIRQTSKEWEAAEASWPE